jgi:hypothetical protein
MNIKLNDNYALTAERHLKGYRLIVLENDNVWVCRKETSRKLNQFMALDEGRIFKGRLQLYKRQDTINVFVKGQPIGTIPRQEFERQLWAV